MGLALSVIFRAKVRLQHSCLPKAPSPTWWRNGLFAEEVLVVPADGIALTEVGLALRYQLPELAAVSQRDEDLSYPSDPAVARRSSIRFSRAVPPRCYQHQEDEQRQWFRSVDLAVNSSVSGINLQSVITNDITAVGSSVADAKGDRTLHQDCGCHAIDGRKPEDLLTAVWLGLTHSLQGRCHLRW